MRWIIISPHFDDAVLSCGGLISDAARRGTPVEIWTICAGYPEPGPLSELATRIHAEWGTDDARQTVDLRRAEDHAAAARVGAAARHFSVPDCIYRRDSAGAFLYTDDVFDPPHPADAGLPEQIGLSLAPLLQADDLIICPLTVGHHVDHVITRQALEMLGRPLSYYADIPYLLRSPEELAWTSVGFAPASHRVSRAGLSAWQRGIAAYTSQLQMLFGSEREMRRQIRAYWQAEQGMRLWSVDSLQSASDLTAA
jgi:LmbE family N-acetylglucosaminyl deacetylase